MHSFTLSWSACSDNVGLWRYEVNIGSGPILWSYATAYTLTGLMPNTTYTVRAVAYDTSFNSRWSDPTTVTTLPDTQAPTVPFGLRSSNVSTTAFSLNWYPSSDDTSVTSYEIFRDGVSLGTVDGTSTGFHVTGLTPGEACAYTVRARDAAGNSSAPSSSLSVVTATPAVIGLHAAGYGTTSGQSIAIVSWEPSDTAPTTRTTTATGAGASVWTAAHQYRAIAPGLDHKVKVTGTSYQRELRFEVPPGYTLYINDKPYTDTATLNLGNLNGTSADSDEFTFFLAPEDTSGRLRPGYATDPQLSVDDTIWSISLGRQRNGRRVGAISLRKANVSGQPFSLDAFTVIAPDINGVMEYYPDQWLGGPWGYYRRMFYAPGNCWVWMDDHVGSNPLSYCEIKVYDPAAAPEWSAADNTYVFKKDGTAVSPYERYVVSSNAPTHDTVTITKNVGTARETSWTFNKSISGGVTEWVMAKAGLQTVRTRSTFSGSQRTEDITIEDSAGTVAQKIQRVYDTFPWGKKELITEIIDPGSGKLNLTSSYTYGSSGASYGKLLSVSRPDSTYTRYEYATDDASYGKLWKTYSRWQDVASTAATSAPSNAQVTTLTYVVVQGFFKDALDTTTTTVPNGSTPTTMAKSERNPVFSGTFNYRKTHSETIKTYSSASEYLTTTRLLYHPDETTDDMANRLISETAPDKTKTSVLFYRGKFTDNGDSDTTRLTKDTTDDSANIHWGEYRFNGFGEVVGMGYYVDSFDGQQIDPLYMVPNRSTVELRVLVEGQLTHTLRYVFTGTSGNSAQFAFLGRDTTTFDPVTGEENHTNHRGGQSQQFFVGDRMVREVGTDGSETLYTYNGLGWLTRKDLTGVGASGEYVAQGTVYTHYTYDAAGRKLTEKISGSSNASDPGIHTSYHYDGAGRLDQQTDPSGLVTTIAYPTLQKTITTLPGGATKIVETRLDGSPKSVSGTAVVRAFDAVAVNADGTLLKTHYLVPVATAEVDIPAQAPRWAKTTTDWLGRVIRTEKPATSGSVAVVQTYNTKGQLTLAKTTDAGTGSRLIADTVTDYNAYGYPYRTGLDVDPTLNSTTGQPWLNIPSTDRFTETEVSYAFENNAWWLTKTTKVFPKSNDYAAVTTAVTKERQNKFASAGANVQTETVSIAMPDSFGNQTNTKTAIDRTNRLVTTTVDVPDSTTDAVTITRNGLVVKEQSAANLTTLHRYDALRRRISSSDPRIDAGVAVGSLPVRVSFYDHTAAIGSRHQQAWTKDTGGYQTTYTYSASTGRLASVQQPAVAARAGAKFTYYDYTTRGELYRQWGHVPYPVEYAYNDYGEKVSMKTYRGGVASVWNQSTWPATPPTADLTKWDYDAATGLLLAKYDAANLDASGNPISGAKKVSYTYTKLGQIKTRTWARGVSTTYKYYGEDSGDALTGELKSTDYSDTPNITPDISYTYNRMGQVLTVAEPTVLDPSRSRTFAYDPAKLYLNTETLPSFYGDRVLTSKHDTTTTGARGRDTGFSLGVTATPTGDYDIAYGYDTYGRSSTFTSDGVTFTYGYQPNSNLIASLSDGGSWTQTRTWQSDRNLLDTIVNKYGTTTKAAFDYDVDEIGHRTTVVQSGEMFSRYVGGGIVTQWSYDDRGQVVGAASYHGTTLANLTYPIAGRSYGYDFDPIGNRLTSTANGAQTGYTTNALNQIVTRTTPGKVEVTGLAPIAASITAQVDTGTALAVLRQGDYYQKTLDVANSSAFFYGNITVNNSLGSGVTRKTFVPRQASDTWTYDDDGNLLTDDRWSYTWDAENRLIAMETKSTIVGTLSADARRLEFTYDYLHRRVEKLVLARSGSSYVESTRTRFIYNGWNLIAEYAYSSSSLTLLRSYSWGLDLTGTVQGAGGVGGLLMAKDGTANYLYAHDGNGNVTTVVNRSGGATAAEYEYTAFGELIRSTGAYAATNRLRFSSKFIDDETGLVYYGRRYYSAHHGRFLCRDPKEEFSGNHLYAFVTNTPINRWDVFGMYDGFLACGYSQGYADWASAPMVNTINPSAATFARMAIEANNRKLQIQQNIADNQALIDQRGRDMAQVSDNVYGRGTLPSNIQAVSKSDITKLGLDPNAFSSASGMAAGLYRDSNSGQYILAFRGTEMTSLLDWGADIAQALGIVTTQYTEAIALGLAVKQATQGNFISTGHSLGGGLASAAAVVSGAQAITFNAAGLNSATVFDYGVDLTNATNLVTAYYVRGEILSAAQDWTPLPDAVGTRVELAPGSEASSPVLHGMDQVLLAIGIGQNSPAVGPYPTPEP